MRIPEFVKIQPSWWGYIPWLSRQVGSTIGSNIYLRKPIYENLLSKNPSPENLSYLSHEMTHARRIKEQGYLKFGVKYLFNRKFRFQEELIANKASFSVLKETGIIVDLDKKAKILSSWLYLWPVSQRSAKIQVLKAWEEA